jgi:hypothetical protein
MLSPNATNDFADSFGGGRTTIGNEHVALRACASLVVHVTVVEPTGYVAPLIGWHPVVSGGCPPVTVGAANETTCADPSSDSTGSGAAGHAIWGAAATGVGAVFEPPQAAKARHTPTTPHR